VLGQSSGVYIQNKSIQHSMSHNNKKYQRETPRRFFVKKSKTSNFGKKNTNYINIAYKTISCQKDEQYI
jgi:hypothetical protein